MPFFIASTVGTSLLTNLLREDESGRIGDIYDHANDSEEEIPEELYQMAEETVKRAVEDLRGADAKSIRKASAELNGILSFYEQEPMSGRDQHRLIATDTALGQLTAEGTKEILEDWGAGGAVQVHTPKGLTTKNTNSLRDGVKRFLDWCEQTLPEYRENEYEVVFNLTGGFKSLQGILNTVGTFYADRMIYIFQAGPELITIPGLPVRLDTDLFENTPARFLRLEALDRVPEGTLPKAQYEDVPEALIDEVEERVYSFSEWGKLLWNRARRSILEQEKCFDLARLRYDERFRSDVGAADPDSRRRLHETLAIVSVMLEVHGGDTAPLKESGSLQYKNYEGKTTEKGNPIGHFQLYEDREGERVSCQAKEEGLLLRRFGRHDAVNNAP
ncbi:hypothetical protein [Salinibacter ruber]|uniref:hypothetical protein n=1 Tax=Salinibacter ruber TaxID=146919 RepID=UPI00216A3905|nr:hypothetical protein [Salinibacter ruber]MCS4099913.1 putative CRISPR-associated protein (TIGR02619 family) [Salinibacter ruber]